MKTLMIYLLVILSLMGQSKSASTNFSADLFGPVDTREGTWGHAEAWHWSMAFTPPVGMRVVIDRVHGDLLSWPKQLTGTITTDGYTGVLFGLGTTAPGGSTTCSPCSDSTFVYLQDGLRGGEVRRTPFDIKLHVVLGTDNTMVVTVASWLNTTGYPIHMEPTFVVEYHFDKEAK